MLTVNNILSSLSGVLYYENICACVSDVISEGMWQLVVWNLTTVLFILWRLNTIYTTKFHFVPHTEHTYDLCTEHTELPLEKSVGGFVYGNNYCLFKYII
jgi:hypothetical protein